MTGVICRGRDRDFTNGPQNSIFGRDVSTYLLASLASPINPPIVPATLPADINSSGFTGFTGTTVCCMCRNMAVWGAS